MLFRKEIISITSLSLFTLLFKRSLLRSTSSVIFPDDLMAISILLLRKLKKWAFDIQPKTVKLTY